MRKIEEILRLHHAGGRSNREIAQTVRVSPTTVADYLRLPLLADLGHDPVTARHYSHGEPLPRRHRGTLGRALPAAATALLAHAGADREGVSAGV